MYLLRVVIGSLARLSVSFVTGEAMGTRLAKVRVGHNADGALHESRGISRGQLH